MFVRRLALLRTWKDRSTQRGIGREHAVEVDQMQASTRHQSGQALDEFQRRHLDVRGTVTPSAFELQHDISEEIRCPIYLAQVVVLIFSMFLRITSQTHCLHH